MSLLLEALQRSQKKPLALEPADPHAAPPAAVQAPATEPTAPPASEGIELTLALEPESAEAAAPAAPAAPATAEAMAPAPVATAPAPAPAAPAPQAAPAAPVRPVSGAAATVGSGTPSAAAPAQASTAARDAAQAMLGAAVPPQRNGVRGRRMVWGLIAGVALAVLSWMGWQYWLSQQRPGLTPVGTAPGPVPEPAVAQGEVAPPPDAASQPLDGTAPTPGSTAPAASAPGVEAVAAAPLPAPTPQAAPAAPPAVAAAPARQDLLPRADRSAATPLPPADRTSPAQETSDPQTAEALTPAPRRRAALKAAAEAAAPASPAASAAAAQLVRSQAQARLQAAWAALREGDAAKAQALYQQVLAERPDDPDATLGLAVALHRQRQHEPAWAAYQRSLQLWPDNDTARTGMLAILSDSDPAMAESRLQEWVQARPRDAAAQAALGNLLGRQGRWPEALGPLTLAQSLAPGHAAYAYNLAVALDQARRYEDALHMYRQALQLGAQGASGVPVRAVERRIAELQELWTQ